MFRLDRKRFLHKERFAEHQHRSRPRYIIDVRPVPSVPVRCVQVDNADHLYLAGRSMIPTHNSTLGLDFARSCSVKHGLTSAVFSLEMSQSEIVMRLLSAEARIRLADMRAGRMSDDDWTRMARRMSEISEAPLFIDDSPNLTLMEIRAKARRLKQRHDLKLVILDYLQLMTSGRKVESRQQEVSEFSRQIKLLAKELEVPVVAISQLNRGPEQRTDKRPMLADLRESGCLTAGTRLLRADTGAEVSLGELLAGGASRTSLLWSLDERMRLVPRPMTAVFPSGVKEVFRVRLASGRTVEATANHPFLTVDGWCPLGELEVGDRLGTPRRVPAPTRPVPLLPGPHRAARPAGRRRVRGQPAAAALRSRTPAGRPTRFPRSVSDAGRPVPEPGRHPRCGCRPRSISPAARTTRSPPGWTSWACSGCAATRSSFRRRCSRCPTSSWRCSCVDCGPPTARSSWDERRPGGEIGLVSTSRRLVDDVSRLLLRFGVLGRIERTRKAVSRDSWHLRITESEHLRAFIRGIGVARRARRGGPALDRRLQQLADGTELDTIPNRVWTQVRSMLAVRRMTHPGLDAARGSRYCGAIGWRHAPSRSRLALAAALLQDAELELTATNDVCWDEVVEITSIGEQPVYDATVPGTHNFVADGIAVHNSIEQDADMVILLHRPDAFERDDPRAGEADLILAKHRNGPTSTITVAHQLHYSRFADLAHG